MTQLPDPSLLLELEVENGELASLRAVKVEVAMSYQFCSWDKFSLRNEKSKLDQVSK